MERLAIAADEPEAVAGLISLSLAFRVAVTHVDPELGEGADFGLDDHGNCALQKG